MFNKSALSYLTMILMLMPFAAFTQLITTDPAFPVVNEPVTVVFDATEGSGGLAGYTGDVYAHTGVITNQSSSGSDWKYVKTSWGQNTPETKLTRIDDDLYSLEISPDIRNYYGVPQNEEILKMAFVFRSGEEIGGSYLEGKTETGGDIFIDVSQGGLLVSFELPASDALIHVPGDSIFIKVNANEANEISLFNDGVLMKQDTGSMLQDTLVTSSFGKHWIKAVAASDTGSVADSFYYYVRKPTVVEGMPQGVKDGINYMDEETVILSLVAPYKEFIFVIGDFNDWEVDSTYAMKMTPDSVRFWLEIDGLVPMQEYIFQYFVDGELRIADPYTDKTSDPWNDQYIPEQVYPGLIDYPAGKTFGIASVLQTGQPEYSWQVENFTPPANEDLIIYETLIRDFTSEHTYQALMDTLDYLENLGINALELMPVNEFEGNSSWGYNPSFYFAPDKYYGPKNDLKALIDACHQRGIAVIIDMVLNHSYDQSPFVQLYFDGDKPTEENPWYNREHNFTNPDAQWGNDFNHESLYTQALVDSINSYWMNEYKVDGFRFDFTKGFGNNIKGSNDPWGSNYDADRIALLKRMADEIWERNPNAIVILEHLAVNSEEEELADYGMLMWGNMNHNYGEAAMGYNESGKSNFSGISYKNRGWSNPHLIGYMESHDEERLMYKNVTYGNSAGYYDIRDTVRALERMGLVSSFFYTVPGPKMIWQFGELGYDYSINYNGRLGEKPVRWDYYQNYYRKYLHDVVASLLKLRHENEVFRTTDFNLDVGGALKKIHLNSTEMDVCIIGNFDLVEGSIDPEFQHTGWWYDYFHGDSLNVTDVNDQITLKPGEYRIYTDVRLETPQINTGIFSPVDQANDLIQSFFPNPTSGQINMILNIPETGNYSFNIFDITGRQVFVEAERTFSKGLNYINTDVQDLEDGLYFMQISSSHLSETVRIIKN